ncbi:MAG: DUF4363 family protein [Oculatellaceae cyanobacterium Prado106]|nr:DUF4363 family protein [Oculatellaceae cyanobacterium Prado106]
MNRSPRLIAVGLVGLLALSGCAATEQASTDAANSVIESTNGTIAAAKDKVTGAVEGFQSLTDVVTQTQVAVNAGDFPKAQAEFAKFEGFWSRVEDSVKAKSPDAYRAIEDSMTSVMNGLKSSQKDQALAALKTLGDSIIAAAKP